MPLFAILFKAVATSFWGFLVALVTKVLALRMAAVLTVAGLYVGAVLAWSAFVMPLLSSLFSTAYGQLLGLMFPPIAGTVVAGLIGLWGVLVTATYYSRVVRIAVG